MRRWAQLLALLLLQLGLVNAAEMQLDQKEENRQLCSGVYSRKSWGGNVDPFILTKFMKKEDVEGDADPVVSLVLFEWRDKPLIGKPVSPDTMDASSSQGELDRYAADGAKFCNGTQRGEFILADNATEVSKNQIITQAIHLRDPSSIHYNILRTGYYCVGTYGYSSDIYSAVVEFRNSYGELPAAQIAKLPFYGGITIVYAVIGAFWAFLYVQNRHDILPVQNYITAIIVFLVVEMLMTWGFYDYQNRHGSNIGSKALTIVVSILNAGRNSFSFFLLLIVCMGYGVVKDSLGKTMIYVRWLAITHFVFGVIYAIGSLTITPDSVGPLVLLVILPLAGTLTAFYIWTLNSLSATMKDLVDRKQTVKALMYKKLWWCILTSIVVIFAFFFVNSWTFAGQRDEDFVPSHWQTRWFILDGWLNLVYLADVSFVAYLWRPTANNRRFAMSDELAQDDDGFEITSIRDSVDLDEELGDQTPTNSRPPAYDPVRTPRQPSPLPAPIPQKPTSLPRESLDGDTIFAVGEDADKWSDDDVDENETPRNSGERKRLTGKDD
ncbi:Membrane protein ptm1 [Cryomyces antarcticus]|nr:Membrane protein ptm1 [Cryomyces antarcticus]